MVDEKESTKEAVNGKQTTDETKVGERLPLKDWVILLSSIEDHVWDYFKHKSEKGSPPTFEDFLDDNHITLAVAGVFGALVVYFSQLTESLSRPMLFAVAGGALMFSIVLLVVLHNAAVALAQAYVPWSTVNVVLYTTTVVLLLLIISGMTAYIGRFSTIVLGVIDIVMGILLLTVVARGQLAAFEVSVPIQCSRKIETFIQASGIFLSVISMIVYIISMAMIVVIPTKIPPIVRIWLDFLSFHNSMSLVILHWIIWVALISIVFSISIIIYSKLQD